MKSYFFHKPSAVLDFAEKDTVLRLRNVSVIMRKRIIYKLKNKLIFVKDTENSKASVLNGFIWGYSSFLTLSDFENPLPVVANYLVTTEKELFQVGSHCSVELVKDLKNDRTLERAHSVKVNEQNCTFYSRLKIDLVDELCLKDLLPFQIETVLANIRSIKHLYLEECNIDSSTFLGRKWFKTLKISCCNVTEPIKLPHIFKMELEYTSALNLQCSSITELEVEFVEESSNLKKLLSTASTLKNLRIGCNTHNLPSEALPASLWYFYLTKCAKTSTDLDSIPFQCPRLLSIRSSLDQFPLSSLTESVKHLDMSIFDNLDCDSPVRLKKVVIKEGNVVAINNHPEIIEDCDSFYIETRAFDLSTLPFGYKRLSFCEIDEDSACLTRFAGKFGQIGPNSN